jgi:AcrR family transcriptional regulator
MARPRNADRIDIPSRAVEVATRLFVERGVDNVTLAEIAAEVGCRAPALYRYFQNKEALLLAVHNDGFRRMYSYKLDAAEAAGASAFERLRLGGLTYVRFAMEHPQLYELMFLDRAPHRHLRALKAAHDPAGEDYALRSQQFLSASIRACQEEGYLCGLDPDIAAFTFWSVVHGAASLALRQRVPFPDIDSEAILDHAVEVMMALTRATRAQSQSDGDSGQIAASLAQ